MVKAVELEVDQRVRKMVEWGIVKASMVHTQAAQNGFSYGILMLLLMCVRMSSLQLS